MYLITVVGNLLIIMAVTSDPHLHIPMYFFCSNLSLADIGFISTTVPKMLVDIHTHSRTISYAGCLTQMSIFLIFGCMDGLLLTAMAYDRFVAICHPLNYPLIMNPCLCVFLILLSFVTRTLEGQLHSSAVFSAMCTVVIPLLNPFIYSLRNRDLKNALSRLYKSGADTSRCPINIGLRNLTHISEFYLLGLSDDLELQPMLFGLFLSMYLITVLGNLLIFLAVTTDPHLHTPMYFFLSILSCVDIGITSTTVPKMLVDIQSHSRAISYVGCLTQISVFLIFGSMEVLLLTVMAYDLIVAICHPLNYLLIMNPRLCVSLVLISFVASILESQLHVLMALQITIFREVEIPNFFCDPSQVLDLACVHSFTDNIIKYFIGTLFGFFPTLGTLFSYYKITTSLLRIPTSGGKYKPFSTCGSHLSVVCLFFGTGIGLYIGSAVSHSPRNIAVPSAMYTVVTPLLNPFIYSLRNRDIKRALKRLYKAESW
ncbi:olfactory receptor 7E178-like [Thomomys bottae]